MNALLIQIMLLKAQVLQLELELQSQEVPVASQSYQYVPFGGMQDYVVATATDGMPELQQDVLQSITSPYQTSTNTSTIQGDAASLQNENDNWLRGWDARISNF